MLKSQSCLVEMSQVRGEINGLPDDADAETLNGLTVRYQRIEAAYRAALIAESEDAAANAPEDGQPAEVRGLIRRASLATFLLGAAEESDSRGAENELRAAVGLADFPNHIPVEMLLPAERIEDRADVASTQTTALQENQAGIIARVFAATAAAYAGADMPTVGVGQANYPVLTAGTTADVRSPGVGLDAAAATLGVETVLPVRATARYLWNMENAALVRGYEEALAADIRSVMGDKLDSLVINGQAAVANVSPAFEGILSALTDPTAASAQADWTDYLGAYTGRVDGKYSQDGSNVRLLVNPETFKHAWDLPAGTDGRAGLLRSLLPGGRFRASANMPAGDSNVNAAIAFAMGNGMGYVNPVWRGVQAIRDPYTGASEGQIALTLQMLTGGLMIRDAMYAQLSFKTTA